MSAIADSCALIVFLQDPNAQARMPNAFPYLKSRPVYVPPMVVWEISRLVAFGKLPRPPVATQQPHVGRQLSLWHLYNVGSGTLLPVDRD